MRVGFNGASLVRVMVVAWMSLTGRVIMGQVIPPAPLQDGVDPNLFYGAVNPVTSTFQTPVLVFIPGLGGRAQDWFEGNDMYGWCYTFGYRTAFISPNVDNTPAT